MPATSTHLYTTSPAPFAYPAPTKNLPLTPTDGRTVTLCPTIVARGAFWTAFKAASSVPDSHLPRKHRLSRPDTRTYCPPAPYTSNYQPDDVSPMTLAAHLNLTPKQVRRRLREIEPHIPASIRIPGARWAFTDLHAIASMLTAH